MTHEKTDVILKKKKKMNNAKQRKKIFKVSITSPMKSFITKTLSKAKL